MKLKIIIFFFISVSLFASCSAIQNQDKIIDLEGKRHKLDYSKHRVYVLFSTLGCHDCHRVLNEYFEKNNLYTNDSVEIIGYIALPKGNLRSVLSRKQSLISFNEHYPNIRKTYFTQENKNKEIIFLDNKIQNYEVPSLLIIKNNTVNLIELKDIFKSIDKMSYKVNEDLLPL